MQSQMVVRRPSECSKVELEAFVTVAAKGEEVERRDIERGANRAAALLWLMDVTGPFAAAALKAPFDSYRERVFRKAGVLAEHRKFTLELGYIYVEKAQRGNGYGPALVLKALAIAGRQGIYATTRADNKRMQEILADNGFSALGSDYASERNDCRLLLFIKPAAP